MVMRDDQGAENQSRDRAFPRVVHCALSILGAFGAILGTLNIVHMDDRTTVRIDRISQIVQVLPTRSGAYSSSSSSTRLERRLFAFERNPSCASSPRIVTMIHTAASTTGF